jgi:hypothetical protein
MATPVYEYEFESGALPELEAESAGESSHESLHELNPVRKIYPDAMMEHMAHEVAEAQSEQEAAEGFLPLIPLVAAKLLPLAAKALPKVAKMLPKLIRTVNRVTPQLTRGVSRITRTLFRNPRTRPLVRTIPSIARRTVASIARQAAGGRPVTPQTAVRTLAQQTRTVLRNPRHRALAIRRSHTLDRGIHRAIGTPGPRPFPATRFSYGSCGCAPRLRPCGCAPVRPAPACCRCCGQLKR